MAQIVAGVLLLLGALALTYWLVLATEVASTGLAVVYAVLLAITAVGGVVVLARGVARRRRERRSGGTDAR